MEVKLLDREQHRKEVRERLMVQTKKKGFMTPERKKALKNMLRNFAKERVKKELAEKAKERQRIIANRIGQAKSISSNMDECK